MSASAEAQNITLVWDASPDPTVVGYTVHVGINPGVFGQTFDVPGRDTTTYTFTQAVPGTLYYFAVSAYNADNVSSPLSNVVAHKINIGPTLSQPASQTTAAGSAASLQLSASDDGDPLTFSATGLPPGLSINRSTGLISGTATTGGAFTVVATVSDGVLTDSKTFTWTVTSALRVTALTSNLPSPQAVGTAVTFTATASGGTAPYQYKFWVWDGVVWTVVRNWSASNTYTWTPAVANGNYRVSVWVRNATTTADVRDADLSVFYPITAAPAPPPLTVTGLTSNLPSPQVVGTPITFTATASGGSAPYQYKFWVWEGVDWRVVRDWSSSNTYTWTPAVANGNYRVSVWVRNSTTTADARDGDLSVPFAITAASGSSPLTVTGLTSNLPSPQAAGTSITFTASASGGTAPYQYKFWVWDGVDWRVVRDWNGSNTYTWTPTVANSNYRVSVWARNATSTADVRDGDLAVPYPITAPAAPSPLMVTALTSSLPSPQVAGTSITFTATATGGTAPYQYKFWVWDGLVWSVVRDWNGSNTYTWTPAVANSEYRVSVWARNATTTADVRDADLSTAFVITSSGGPAGPLVVTGLTSNLPSPQVAGTSITFTATATGGTAPYQYKFWVWDGIDWRVVRDWSGSNTYTWTPLAANSNYRVSVWARNATTTADVRDGDLSTAFVITAPGGPSTPLTVTGLTSNLPSPQAAGTSITFTATATGGTAPYQYKFWVWDGLAWTVVRDWSGSSTYTWTPLAANSNYRVSVWARNATTSADVRDADLSVPFVITAAGGPATPLTVTALTSNLPSPQTAGTSITFTATATGGTAPYQYKFWVWDGIAWTVVRDWSGANSYTWTPAVPGSSYRVSVWVRNATTTADVRDGDLSVPFTITAAGGPATPLTVASLASSLPSPQVAGTSITFTATATGGTAPYQYKFWVWDGIDWRVVRGWSGSNTYTWTPTAANSGYRVSVWARNATTTADERDADLAVPFVITAPGAPATPLTITALTSNRPSPQVTGTSITFTATATGGATPYQYKFWVFDGIDWRVVRSWSTSNTYTWTPTAPNHAYRISVWMRNATTTEDVRDADMAVPFVINAR